jgi:rSAM/selenodomain-associated transferase 1
MANKRIEWIVLTKAPVPGLVKTRLIDSLGELAACDVYEQLLVRMKNTLKKVINQSDTQVAVWVAGNIEHKAFVPWKPFADFYQQPAEGDLGVRMAMAVQSSLARGCIPVLIGVDVPGLDEGYLLDCLKQLEHNDLVISPAEDGGYGLLGMKQFYPELFQNKHWGTNCVFDDTEKDIKQLEIQAAYLSKVWDVDEVADVERWLITSKFKPSFSSKD